ncbi:MAG: hypothetical protein E3J21_04680 [Anaerolineales bacterium]|nr:MAG: hypothetical protein E3J21_04680 [Anaerolineales bacterium]
MNIPLQLAMGMYAAHRNQYLFSDHYLDNLLPQDPRWAESLPEAETFLTWLQGLYAREQAQLPNYTESQLEDHWFKPILTRLGHAFERQAGVPGLNAGVKRPDYVFFPDEAARQAAVSAQKTEDYAADALAVGEVKRWDVPLGKKQKGGGASFEAQNPSWQIDYYIRATELDWGILSNGRLWRLVHKDTSQRLAIYYEVDLVDLLSRGDAEAMRYFTLFFRQAAFQPDAQGRLFLKDALAASNAYAVALEEDLEQNVYQALEQLMQGFLDLPKNGLGADDLRQIYDNSLYLLYRLLFILYGESRGLLPLQNEQYRANYSLTHIKEEIATLKAMPAPMTTLYWGQLQNLFHIINGDDAELNHYLGVPRYNGGLFHPQLHPFLEQKAVGDRALVEAIDLLSRRTTEAGREFVDYRTLGVRHLGSIYEGLLEYQPRYATEPMAAIRDGKRERWVKTSEVSEDLGGLRVLDRRDAGQVYLETDRGERRATGSYYTPQYIVEYIVENTLGPLVDEALERVKARAKGAKSRAARAEAEQSLVDEILSLKVLDPAMGSGHFLVEATEYLALELATDPYVETEVSVEEDLIHWKRRVVERCIYGVDKNPLAVELAKLSLWLATVAADKPLSFLDHHLKCGDSLIGARVADLGWAPPVILSKKAQKQLEQQKAGQINMFEYLLSQRLPVVMGRILEITEVESDSYDTVRAKEAADQAVQRLKAPFEAVADLWVSAYFANQFTPGEYDEGLGLISKPDELLALPAVQQVQGMVGERNFFHWELAFPEVFYDRHGQPLRDAAGFDVVIGNPPYVSFGLGRTGKLSSLEETFYRVAFERSAEYKISIYALFMEQALAKCRFGGYESLIVPDSFLNGMYFSKIREYILLESTLQYVVVFDHDFWKSGDVGFPTIFITKKRTKDELADEVDTHFLHARASEPEDLLDNLEYLEQSQNAQRSNPRMRFRLLGKVPGALINKMQESGLLLGTILSMHHGIRSKIGRSKIIADKQLGPDWKKALISSAEIHRHSINPETHFIRVDPNLLFSGGWDPNHIERSKILIRRTGDSVICVIDANAYYHTNALIYGVPTAQGEIWSLFALSAILNSELMNFYYQRTTMKTGRTLPQVEVDTLKHLPIRCIEFATPTDEREQLVAQSQSFYAAGDHDTLLAFTDDCLATDPEQSDVVHDLLAHLAEQMIEMNKGKQVVVEAFWLDLEGVTEEAAFETLRNKGKQERTLWKRGAACRPFVAEDSHATRRLEESLAWSEDAFKAFVKVLVGKVKGLSDLVGVYRAHSPAYRELVAHIEATDWLIDQIVYKLYGLTEEEIAIVEGR